MDTHPTTEARRRGRAIAPWYMLRTGECPAASCQLYAECTIIGWQALFVQDQEGL